MTPLPLVRQVGKRLSPTALQRILCRRFLYKQAGCALDGEPGRMARVAALTAAVGRVIAEQRKRVGLSQEALAFASGLHRTYISLVERGLNAPTVTTLYDLSGPLQVPPSELLRRIEAVVPPAPDVPMSAQQGRVSRRSKSE